MFEDTLIEDDVPLTYVSAGATDAGLLRSSNQDAFVDRIEPGVWAVADGMGGYRDGDVASRMVCEALSTLGAEGSLDETIEAARRALSEVNARLQEAASRPIDPVLSGSTAVVFLARSAACAIVWAGDSRAYRYRNGTISQLTTDHTWAAELNLKIPSEEADHAITRAVGGEETLDLDVRRDHVHPGDRYLLCSDGLTRELSDEQIADQLAAADVQACVRGLIEATLAAGARDNVTVVVIEAR